jgi:predicted ribosomally synthesized peptide with SipW-like signal peptide
MLKILKSLMVVVAVAAIATSATKAAFTDQVTSPGNSVTAGTLSLTVNGSHSPSAVFTASNMSPGGASGWATAVNAGGVALQNTGSIKGHVWFSIQNIVVTGGDGSLADRIDPQIELNQAPWGTNYTIGQSLNALNGVHVDVMDLTPGQTVNIMAYNLWPDAGSVLDNAAQGQSLTYDVVFHLDQV